MASSLARTMMGSISTARAMLAASMERMVERHDQAFVGEDADHDGRHPAQHVGARTAATPARRPVRS